MELDAAANSGRHRWIKTSAQGTGADRSPSRPDAGLDANAHMDNDAQHMIPHELNSSTGIWHGAIIRVDAVQLPEDVAARWLSPSERLRLESVSNPARRQQYLAGHWLLRSLLSQACGGPAQDWQIEDRRGRGPAVQCDHTPIYASLSHSGAWLAGAIASQPVGVDIEARPRRGAAAALASVLLNEDEPPGSISEDQLLGRWVALEAWIKARQGAALPEQLRRLRLVPATPAEADLMLYRSPDYWYASAPGSSLGAVKDADSAQAYRVTER